jgi:hypothetical protein
MAQSAVIYRADIITLFRLHDDNAITKWAAIHSKLQAQTLLGNNPTLGADLLRDLARTTANFLGNHTL